MFRLPCSRTRSFLRFTASAAVVSVLAIGSSGCISDTDCGICDPDNLYLTSITAVNYAGNPDVHLISPACDGDACPEQKDEVKYYTSRIGPCEETEEAQDDPFGPTEYCRLSPLMTLGGVKFVFNNLLEATTIELSRKDPNNPNLWQVYQWKPDILHIEGPITRFNGDYYRGDMGQPDIVTRYVNLSCVDNLRAEGRDFGHENYEEPLQNPCNTLQSNGRPYKMWTEVEPESGFPAAITRSYEGAWDWRSTANSCTPPSEGPDTCCSQCDYELSVNVAKYGVPDEDSGREDWLNPNSDEGSPGAALRCDPGADRFAECRDFVTWVDRSEEYRTYTYAWSSRDEKETFRVPYFDKLRETHPNDRPAWLEDRETAPHCQTTQQCVAAEGHDLPGTECIGRDSEGNACDPALSATCEDPRCLARWVVNCTANPDTTGSQGFCVDGRFSDTAARSCFQAETGFKGRDAGSRIVLCDSDVSGSLTAAECCLEELGNTGACDPYFQENVVPIARYDRDANLPDDTRTCVCFEDYEDVYDEGDSCRSLVERVCFDEDGNFLEHREGDYALSYVVRSGGVIYDPAIKGVEWRPGNFGLIQRARLESCWETRTQVLTSDLNVRDGWRANDRFASVYHYQEDFDRAMCSGQEYTVVFNVDEDEGTVLTDKVGNTLADRTHYTFETPQFHVVPGSGFPLNTMQIGACNEFALAFSNKYDMSPENLTKLRLVLLREDDDDASGFVEVETVAGGPDCAETSDEADETGAPPCLTVDVNNQFQGGLEVQIDPVEFGGILQPGEWYRLKVPGLETIDEMEDEDKYYEAFWDVCGMPLVLGDEPEQRRSALYDFQIDPPLCKEDEDRDNFPQSCDNARDHFNPDQGNIDNDLFGDVIDLCPTVFTTNNRADSDVDGVGNACDNCRKVTSAYNEDAGDLGVPFYMRVRNVPAQPDLDGDGIGDVCDNCVVVANCEDYNENNRWRPGRPIDVDNRNLCQRDDNRDMIGDQCEEFTDPNGPFATDWAAGPIGFGDSDDFDQDGLSNLEDNCPRLAVEHVTCSTNADCEDGAQCVASGVCNHVDTDMDGLGDSCDTCPFVGNPEQVVDGAAQQDDDDGDFIGARCEASARCAETKDPRPLGFYEVSVNGYCCVTRYPGGRDCTVDEDCGGGGQICDEGSCALRDPDGVPIRLECSEQEEEDGICRPLPSDVRARPGMTELPTGCQTALDAAGITEEENVPLGDDYPGDLWSKLCFLPQWDQDFDGLGDRCDLCPYAFDPTNAPYRDQFGKVWPTNGHYCTAEYNVENICEADDDDGGDDDSGTDGGTDGGDTDDGDETGDGGTDG